MQDADFSVGQLVTGMKGPVRVSRVPVANANGMIPATEHLAVEDRSFQGSVFLVAAVALPYVVLRQLVSWSGNVPGQHTTIGNHGFAADVRLYTFALVTRAYAMALNPNVVLPAEPAAGEVAA